MSLQYEDKTKLIPQDCFLFSVTDIALYKHNPTEFFKKVLLKESSYEINFNATLGTCVHHLCSSFYEKKQIEEVDKEINEFLKSLNPEEIDTPLLWDKYTGMKEVVIETLKQNEFNFGTPTEIEKSYIHQLSDKIYLGGTLDIRFNQMIMDYKTTTNKYIKSETEFPEKYSNQLYAYAWLCKQQGIEVTNLALQYFTQPDLNRYSEVTFKPLKDYPCRDVLSIQPLQYELLQEIEETIKLIAETLEYILKYPESFRLFARDLTITLGKVYRCKKEILGS